MITDEQIIYDALRRYTHERQKFCEFVFKPDAVNAEGEPFTEEEKTHAAATARQCQRITDKAAENLQKQQSPILRVN